MKRDEMFSDGAEDATEPDAVDSSDPSIPPVSGWMEAAERFPGLDPAALQTTLLFLRAADGILDAFEDFFTSRGFSDGRFTLLMMYVANPDLSQHPTPSELASFMGVTRGTVTGLLDGLERSGFVAREPHPEDRRMLAIRITEEGRRLVERLMPEYFRRAVELTGNLDEGERRRLVELLEKMYRNIPAVAKGSGQSETLTSETLTSEKLTSEVES